MIDLKKLTRNSLFGKAIRKDVDEEPIIRSENWLMKSNDEQVANYGNVATCEIIIKYESDHGFDKI